MRRGFDIKLFEKHNETNDFYQCKRSVCKKAERPSISTRMPTVRIAQKPKTNHNQIPPIHEFSIRPLDMTILHKTSDNSEKKKI